MKTLEELAFWHMSGLTRRGADRLFSFTPDQLESLINEVISQRLGEPVAYAYVNDDGKCEEIEYIGHKDDTGVYEEFTQLYALNIES